MASLAAIIKRNRFTQEDLPAFERKLFFEGDQRERYLVRFAVLMFLSTVIATGAVIIVTGPEVLPTITSLGEQIETDVRQVKEVHVLFVPSKEYFFEAGDVG